ncbi:transmembrane protein 143-like, partial [Scyliorhinus torazame]|uniref:transmembrane protein 143-like n=1 Tax=Scyliorhinus torazame TaxID=75743 RepID=UPI003B591880
MLRASLLLRPVASCRAGGAPGWFARDWHAAADGRGAPSVRPLSDAASTGDSESPTETARGAAPASPSGSAKPPRERPTVYQERFIPFDKNVLHLMLLKELSSVTEPERDSLTKLVEAAEADTMEHYHAVLERLMALYEPINPDRDTLPDLILDDAVQLDQETNVLDNLSLVLEQANFNRLSEDTIQRALSYRDPLFKSQ